MNILHYSLGFPPARRGGMTAYCLDLIDRQTLNGNDVSLIWPGRLIRKTSNCEVVRTTPHSLPHGGVCNSFAIRNPLPITLVDGIADPSWQLISKDISTFERFFEQNHFDILHIHTFMGLPKELPQAAQHNGVRVVYTTHDYYAICGKLTLYHNGDVCNSDRRCVDCCTCNSKGLSISKIRIIQSPIYGYLKETKLALKLRKKHIEQIDEEKTSIELANVDGRLAEDYFMLRSRNIALLNSCDHILFNSTQSKEIYEKYGTNNQRSSVLHVSNSGIIDNRLPVIIGENSNLMIGYFGGPTNHKGRGMLIEACDLLWRRGINRFRLHVYGNYAVERPYAISHPPYKRDNLAQVMQEIDLAVIPSKWYETFGFVTSESMSFGRPVVVSDRVGAKDIVIDGLNGRVFNSTVANLFDVLLDIVLHPQLVERYSQRICTHEVPYTMEQHALDVDQVYRGICI